MIWILRSSEVFRSGCDAQWDPWANRWRGILAGHARRAAGLCPGPWELDPAWPWGIALNAMSRWSAWELCLRHSPFKQKNNGEPVGATDRVFQKIGNWLLGTRVIYDWYNLCLERLLRFQWDTPRTSPFTNCCPISSLLSLFVSRFTSV